MKQSIDQNELTSSVSQEDISQRARELWEGHGRPAGRDQEIWLEAESQLREIDSIMKATGFISVSSAAYVEASPKTPRIRQQKAKPKLQAQAEKTDTEQKPATPAKSATPAGAKSAKR